MFSKKSHLIYDTLDSKSPDPFLEVSVERLDLIPTLCGWCAGYENQEWRSNQLADHLFEWLPEFALRHSEREHLSSSDAVKLLRKAARSIYSVTEKATVEKRGEIGEILLHLMVRQHYKSIPAISKYFYKDSTNDTVKGFDAVHVVQVDNELQLWLGEVKFYKSVSSAIADVVEELQLHTGRDYLRSEFTAITNKLDESWEGAEQLKKLLHENNSLDNIFKRVCIPVLLTYESSVIDSFKEISDDYKSAFEEEVLKYRNTFAGKTLPENVIIHLFLFPLHKKQQLVEKFDEVLKKWQ